MSIESLPHIHKMCGYGVDSSLTQASEVTARYLSQHRRLPDVQVMDWFLRRARSSYVWPRVWGIQGEEHTSFDSLTITKHIRQWLGPQASRLRCGIASYYDPVQKRNALVVIATEPRAELEPLPEQVRAHTWVTLRAKLRDAVERDSHVRVLVLPPVGQPKTVFSSISNQAFIRAQFSLTVAGRHVIQVVADGENGPAPVLETDIYVDIKPPKDPSLIVPSNDVFTSDEQDPNKILFQALNKSRTHENLPLLQRKTQLDGVAYSHTLAMMQRRVLSHNVGLGDARIRTQSAGIYASTIGENIARAKNAHATYRMLYASPSHRANILDARFRYVGVAAIRNQETQELWITHVFHD